MFEFKKGVILKIDFENRLHNYSSN